MRTVRGDAMPNPSRLTSLHIALNIFRDLASNDVVKVLGCKNNAKDCLPGYEPLVRHTLFEYAV